MDLGVARFSTLHAIWLVTRKSDAVRRDPQCAKYRKFRRAHPNAVDEAIDGYKLRTVCRREPPATYDECAPRNILKTVTVGQLQSKEKSCGRLDPFRTATLAVPTSALPVRRACSAMSYAAAKWLRMLAVPPRTVAERPQVEFVGPHRTVLLREMPEGVRDLVGQ